MRKTVTLLLLAPLLVGAFAYSSASAQPSSPSGRQGNEEAPAPEGPSQTAGVSTGGEDEGGNRTTPGGAGAEGTAPGDRNTGASAGRMLALVGLLALACLAAFLVIRRRSRRADERLEV